ncbi:MAG: helix-turn-helix transcriptional regulator [Synergistaceae bacterium]|nr:helix-turn-helix transcriptional regulator [Synergistaceae bacterium]
MENDLNYKLIGSRIRAIRKKRGYTQEQLSELADISPQHCSGIECGAAKVSLPALVRLCNALGATPDEVLMDSVKQSAPLYAEKIAEVFSDCSPDETYLMLSQAENLKKALRTKGLFKLRG